MLVEMWLPAESWSFSVFLAPVRLHKTSYSNYRQTGCMLGDDDSIIHTSSSQSSALNTESWRSLIHQTKNPDRYLWSADILDEPGLYSDALTEPVNLEGVSGGGQEGEEGDWDVFEDINISGNEAALFLWGCDRWRRAEGFDQLRQVTLRRWHSADSSSTVHCKPCQCLTCRRQPGSHWCPGRHSNPGSNTWSVCFIWRSAEDERPVTECCWLACLYRQLICIMTH